MFGLTSLGFIHALISLVALFSGIGLLIRHRGIAARTGLGHVYLVTTFLTGATALFIFRRGTFGPPHAMAIVTMLAVAAIYVAAYTDKAGKWSRHVTILSFTSTLLFHFIAGVTETLTRVPPSAPVLPGPEAPQFLHIYAVIFAVIVLLGFWQWRAQRESQ